MGDEEDTFEGPAVEGCKPGLPETGRKHHEPRAMVRPAGRGERLKGCRLDRMRRGRGRMRLVRDDAPGKLRERRRAAARGIGLDPVRGERADLRPGEQRLEGRGLRVCGLLGVEVPLPPVVSAARERLELPTIAAPCPRAARKSQALGWKLPVPVSNSRTSAPGRSASRQSAAGSVTSM